MSTLNKEMFMQLWNYVVYPELLKRAKSTHSKIDDFILKQCDMAFKEVCKTK